MLERLMEDLIAKYPDEFFPGKGFELKGRQQSFAGVGRFDLLFRDLFKTNVLMELKAVPARYDVASQLARYKDELQHRGESNILMWLVAPQISNSVREFLDRIGIEYSEIHVTEFRRVAVRHGIPIEAETSTSIAGGRLSSRSPQGERRASKELVLPRSREVISAEIRRIFQKQQTFVTREQLAEQLEKQAWVADRLAASGVVELDERQKRTRNLVDWFSKEYTSGEFNLREQFEREKVDGKWAYRPRLPSQSPLSGERKSKKQARTRRLAAQIPRLRKKKL